MKPRILCSLAIFAAILSLPEVSQGYWGSYYAPYQTAIGVHFFPGAVRDPGPLPHFAVYPPVYYSQPIARTYGQYPFAYLPQEYAWPGYGRSHGVAPCGSAATKPEPSPLMVSNPYVKGDQTAARPADAVQPLRIRNPYVGQPTGTDRSLAATAAK